MPIFKGGTKRVTNNYRPKRLIPINEKKFEEIISGQVKPHIKENNIIIERQQGFQEVLSTKNDLMQL